MMTEPVNRRGFLRTLGLALGGGTLMAFAPAPVQAALIGAGAAKIAIDGGYIKLGEGGYVRGLRAHNVTLETEGNSQIIDSHFSRDEAPSDGEAAIRLGGGTTQVSGNMVLGSGVSVQGAGRDKTTIFGLKP